MNNRPEWRKSSRSGQGNNCVEVATNVTNTALIRDSKLGDESPILDLAPEAFASFISAAKSGKLDR